MPSFTPPTQEVVPLVYAGGRDSFYPRSRVAHRLFRYYRPHSRGRSVLRIAGAYGNYWNPTQDQINSASEVYLGGHIYEIDAATATSLTNAGYGSYIT